VENRGAVLSLRNISLTNFKNYESLECSFDSGVNCILGLNGSGKTNLLDAIYYLCYTKSYFHHNDLQSIRHEQQFFRIDGIWEKKETQQRVVLRMPRGGKKILTVNETDIAKLLAYIGNYTAVMITPDDNELISGGSETRRRFLDVTLALVEPDYLNNLLIYQKLLVQRNALLKDFAEQNHFDALLLDTYDNRMAIVGNWLWKSRASFLEQWLPLFLEQYQYFVDADERPQIKYAIPAVPLEELLSKNRPLDRKALRTTAGPHTDDLEFVINDYPLRKTGSQGQQKSFLVALKLAQWRSLRDIMDVKPVLLLDDIFDKLDNKRISKLIQLMKIGYLGQVFITDTDSERMKKILKEERVKARFIMLKKGVIETR